MEKTKQRYFSKPEKQPSIKHDDDFLFIKSEYKIVRINLSEIKYIEGMRDYVRIHILNKKPIMALLNMGNIMEHLPAAKFMRVHRSFIVNLDKIYTIERNRIIFDKDKYIPVSDQYKDGFHKFLKDNFLK